MKEQAEIFKNLILSLIKQGKAQFDEDTKKAGIDITTLQYAILAHLSTNGITLNDLAKLLANKPPTLAPAVDHLEEKEYIKKTQDTKDRRKVKIVITSKGQGILKKLPLHKSSSALTKGFAKLGKEKTEILLSLLKELTQSIKK